MNNLERELKLQAYLDGELSAAESSEVERWLDQDAHMVALSAELKQTKTALKSGELEVKCPETREFYWSKIARSIELEERQAARAAAPQVAWWRKLFVPMGALGALAITVTMIQMATSPANPYKVPSPLAVQINEAIVEPLDESMGSLTYKDNSEGVTVVWHYDRTGDI
jgi:anti-sigma factor RsiW